MKPWAGSADAGLEELGSDGGEAGEVAGGGEGEDGGEKEDGEGGSEAGEGEHEGGGGEEIGDVGGFAAETVRDDAEGDVAEPHAELHEDGRWRSWRRAGRPMPPWARGRER